MTLANGIDDDDLRELADEKVFAECPECGARQEDQDGFGVLFCAACGYCEHSSASGSPMRCDVCGRLVVHDIG